MTNRSWQLLLACTVLGAAGCALAAVVPGTGLGDCVVYAGNLASSALLWIAGGRGVRRLRGWRLLALGLPLPGIGLALGYAVHPASAVELVALRWLTTVPGFALATLGVLTLVPGRRLRAAGRRVLVELALFTTAALVPTQLLLIGPDGAWRALGTPERLVLGAAVVATSAAMAAAFTVLGVVERGRQRAALLLLLGTVLLSTGCSLTTVAMVTGHDDALALSRFSLVAGLALLGAAALLDPGRRDADEAPRPTGGRSTELGRVLPHVAMVAAVAATTLTPLAGYRPGVATVAGTVVCVGLAALHRWLTARDEQRLDARLRRSEAYFRSLVRSGADAVLILDDGLRLRWASPALDRVLGDRAAALVGAPLLAEVHPDDAGPLRAALGADPAEGPAGEPGLVLVRLPDAAGAWRHLEVAVSDLRGDADVGAVVLHCRDMTERNARERALRSVAYTDPVTGLPNRAGWARAVDAAAAAADRGGAGPGAALLLLELDGLPEAREQAGGEVVSSLVAEIGRRLRATVRGEDVVARLGGGAFAVLAQGTPTETDRLAARCLAVVELPIPTRAGLLEVTAGIGVALLEPGVPADELRARAELAVRAAREAGSGRATRYEPSLGAAAERRERLRADLEGARARGEMSLVFQPVVATAQRRVGGVEALLRWRHPELGELPPEEFLPIAERSGLGGELHRWVLREAMTALTSLPEADQPHRLGINLSAGYLAGGTAVPDVEQALRVSGLPAERLVVEVTEAATGSPLESVAQDVAALRLMGVSVALDDFGTGQSALGSLTRVPLDVLKLDPSLVTRIDRDPKILALCGSVVGIGRALGLLVVAEGVETPAQLSALVGIGCDGVQGFLLGRPVPIQRIGELLHADAGALWPGLVATS